MAETRGRKPKNEEDIDLELDSNENEKIEKELEKANAEKEEMAKMLENMQKQMAEMQKQMNNQSNANVTIQQVSNPNSTRSVKVTNMLPYGIVLSVPNSRTVFNKFGETIPIKFAYMNEIVTKYLSYLEDGRIVFEKQEDYEDLNVGYIYDSIMKFEHMEDLILLKRQDSVKTILELDKKLQERIIPLIADAWIDGKITDYTPIKQLDDEGLEIDEMINIKKANKEINE